VSILSGAPPVREWLQALSTESNTVCRASWSGTTGGGAECLDCAAAIPNDWQSLFRTCFSLAPPASGETDWTLAYFLQADDPEFLVDAERFGTTQLNAG